MSEETIDFNELLKRARKGDRASLERLALTYEKDVRIAARVLLGPALRPHLDSIDIVQTVHRSLLLGVQHDKFNVSNPDQLIALAMTLVRRKVARQWRKHRRQLHLNAPTGTATDLPGMLASLQTTEPDPARAAQLRDAQMRVLQALDAVDRRLLDLRLQGFSTSEAARLLGENPDIMRVRLHRLRQQLHELGILDEWL